MTLDTELHHTRDGSLPPRAKQLVKVLHTSEIDLICLQGLDCFQCYLISFPILNVLTRTS